MRNIEKCILTNMCMICDGTKVLVQKRVKNWKGVSFPGGHIEERESFVLSTIREIYEETGLIIKNLSLCGIKQYTHNIENYRYIVFLYKTNSFEGELKSSEEGEVFWIQLDEIKNYKLSEGFEEMLEIFLNDKLSENYYYLKNNEWVVKNL